MSTYFYSSLDLELMAKFDSASVPALLIHGKNVVAVASTLPGRLNKPDFHVSAVIGAK